MQPAPSSADRTSEFREGQTLAGCYLLRRRAEGTGNRVVWLAHDEVLGKEVSLHFLPPPVLDDAEAIAVLRHEVKRTRQLIHPSILRVYDFVQEDDWAAVAMDAFTGRTLEAVAEAKPGHFFEIAEIRPWLATLCHTLDDAHRIQLVHGDLSPENVIIEEDGRARIANFGLSICVKHAMGELENDDASDGPPVGHQSPQQLGGNAPTAVDDIYALGVLIHRLLVGSLPFAPTPEGRAPAGIAAHRARLSRRGAPIPVTWEKLVAACLDRDPGNRPKSASEIVRRLGLDRMEPEAVIPPANAEPEAAAPMQAAPKGADAAISPAEPVAEPGPANILKARSAPDREPKIQREPEVRPREPEARPVPIERNKRSKFQPVRSPDSFVSRKGRRSRSPAIGLAAVAAAAVIGLIIFFSNRGDKGVARTGSEPTTPEESAEAPPTVPTVTTNAKPPAGDESAAPREPDRKPPEPAPTIAVAGEPARDPVPPPATVPTVVPPSPAPPAPGPDAAAAARLAALADPRKALESSEKALQVAEQHKETADQAAAELKARIETAAKALAPLEKAAGEVAARRKAREDELRMSEQAARQAEQNATEKKRLAEEGRKSIEGVDASLAALKTMVDANGKPFAPIKKAADEMATLRKKREADVRTAEAGAQQAQKAAEEKAQRTEQARQAVTDAEAQGSEQLAARERATAELIELQSMFDEKQRLATEAATGLSVAMNERNQHAAEVQRSEQAITDVKAAADKVEADKIAAEAMAAETARKTRETEAQRLADQKKAEMQKLADAQRKAEIQKARESQEAREREKQRLEKELADELARIKQAFSERLAKVDEALANPSAAEPKPGAPESPPSLAESKPAPAPPTVVPAPGPPAETAKPPPARAPVPTSSSTDPSKPPIAPAVPGSVSDTPAVGTPTEMAKLETKPLIPRPAPVPPGEPDTAPPAGGAEPGYVNSLGMKFAPVGDVLFCIWQTRVKDFEAFAKATGLKSLDWRDPGFKQGSDHPVVRVTWQEAILFCKWLTARERKDARLAPNQEYRLPTDLEWSRAVGLPGETGKTPEARDMSIPDVYPWGTQWPPPPGAGNYTGEETGSDVAIRGYNDGFPWTSPVGQFAPNQFGLFDMGGNVWQWCQDTWSNESKAKVLRGASWYNGAVSLSLLSSCRVHAAPDGSTDNYGFRVVIARANGEKPSRK